MDDNMRRRRRRIGERSLLVIASLVLAGTSSAAAGNSKDAAPGQSAPGNLTLPTVSGYVFDGSAPTASPGDWTGPSAAYAYQWQRCDSAGAACSAIAGATSATYLLATGDVGATVRVTVVASNKNGSAIATSAPTAVVSPRPASTGGSAGGTGVTTATTTGTTTTPTATTTTSTTSTTGTSTTGTTTTGTTTTAPSTSETPYLNWDFSTGDLSQVLRLHDVWNGDTPATYRASVQSHPASPSPASRSAKIVTFNGQSSSSTTGDLSMLGDIKGRPWEAEGQTTWYRLDVLFPSGGNAAYPGSFTNRTPGSESGFNKFLTWHESGFSDGYASPASSAYFVYTSPSQPFRFDFFGGDGRGASTFNATATNPGTASWISALDLDANGNPIPLRKDHWYTIVSQVKWSRTAGWAKIWVDGRLAFPNPQHRLKVPYNGSYSVPATFPTLWWDYNRNTSGRIWMMAGHYRKPQATWTDTIYMTNIKVGPTQGSVTG